MAFLLLKKDFCARISNNFTIYREVLDMNKNVFLKICMIFVMVFCVSFTPNVLASEENNDTNLTNDNVEAIKPGGEVHTVSVIIDKVDENGNPLEGATLQILDQAGNVVEEWISDGNSHKTMLPEGDYILHEKSAPQGYIKAEDKPFTIKVEVNELDAGVDFSETPCQHYGGTPLYYVEINGQKSEVYCINQDWETPDENSIYDGGVLTSDDIKNYTQQTVYIDAHQNTALIDVSDQY